MTLSDSSRVWTGTDRWRRCVVQDETAGDEVCLRNICSNSRLLHQTLKILIQQQDGSSQWQTNLLSFLLVLELFILNSCHWPHYSWISQPAKCYSGKALRHTHNEMGSATHISAGVLPVSDKSAWSQYIIKTCASITYYSGTYLWCCKTQGPLQA